jgi:hypothetical protein
MLAGVSRRTLLLVGVAVALLLTVVAFGPAPASPPDDTDSATSADAVRLVTVADSEARLWPYTSRRREFDTRTLPINVVVENDLGTTRRVLAAEDNRSWETDAPEGEAVVLNGSGVTWSETTGADRYTYVGTDEGGYWMDESDQIHDGAYLGSRYHLRLYEVSDGPDTYTAIQAHTEHWDWFRLRHTVGSTARARYAVEHEFYGTGTVADVSRERFGNGGALDADGWVTVFDLVDYSFHDDAVYSGVLVALLAVAGGRSLVASVRDTVDAVRRSRVGSVHVALFGTLFLVPVAVRVTAVSLERALPGLSPKVIAAPLYLVLAVGLPVVAALLGRRLAADDAFATASVGLGLGLLADYTYLGITTLPVGVVFHRLVLLVGIGLLAAGGVRWASQPLQRHRYLLLGAVIWVAALVWPLAGL